MKRAVQAGALVFSLSMVGCAAPETAPPPPPDDSEAIASSEQHVLGGDAVTRGQFPTVVAVLVGQGGLCTGTLVAPDLVLTAAHCIDPAGFGLSSQEQLTGITSVILDATSLFSPNGSEKQVAVSATIPHPAFTQPGQPDVGLVKLATPVTDRDWTPINLNPAAAPVGISVTAVGFGVNDTGQAGTNFYLENHTSVSCTGFGISDATFLCFDQQSGSGKCTGDSGGPSFATIDGVEAVVGITSFGDQNCGILGADMRVDASLQFFIDNAPELLCRRDNMCDEKCGTAGLTEDPDCAPACVTDKDCDSESMCGAGGSCEPRPFSPGGLGSECATGTDCASGMCATGSEGGRCSTACDGDSDCPDGFACQEANDGSGVCWESSGGGCSAGGNSGTAFGLLFIGLGMALFGRRRRRA